MPSTSAAEAARPHSPSDPEADRDETATERLDRNTVELLNELRVSATGVQVMLAFLLVVPFNVGYRRMTRFDRYDYYVTLVCMLLAAVLLMAPSIHHRLLFRQAQKGYLVRTGNALLIAAMAFMSLGLTGILVLISNVVFGASAAIVAGILALAVVGVAWFAVPISRRRALSDR